MIVGARQLRQRPDERGPRLRLSRLGLGPATTAAWTAESDQAGASLRLLASRTAGRRQRRRLLRRDRRRVRLRQRRDGRGPRLRLPRLGRGPRDERRSWTAESNQANAGFGCVGRDGGRRQRRRLRRRHRRRATATTTARRTRGAPSSTSARPSGLATTPGLDGGGQPGRAPTSASSVATAGDVNGDGYSRRHRRGATATTTARLNEGRAFVYLGSASGLATTRGLDGRERPGRRSTFGDSVATAGDVNGDGYSDVIVGAYVLRQRPDGRGARVTSTSARPRAWPRAAAWTAEGEPGGRRLRLLGRDGGRRQRRRLLPTSSSARDCYDNGQTDEGRAFVYHGSADGPRDERRPGRPRATRRARRFGCSVATAGDVNGDGYSDVIVGAFVLRQRPGRTRAAPSSTSARPPASRAAPAWTAESDQASAELRHLGRPRPGDVNGDGYSDVIVGAALLRQRPDRRGARLPLLRQRRRRPEPHSAPAARRRIGADRAARGDPTSTARSGFARSGAAPPGADRVRLEWEVKPLGTPFDASGDRRTRRRVDTGAPSAGRGQRRRRSTDWSTG